MSQRRVVITGLGVVAPNGIGKEEFWANLVKGNSAVNNVLSFDASAYPCKVAAEVRNFQPLDFVRPHRAKVMARFAHFATAAARLAVEDSRISGQSLRGAALCQGTAAQGIADLGERAHKDFLVGGWKSVEPLTALEYTAHAATSHVQAEINIGGPSITLASACCTGIDAVAWGAEQIRAGRVSVALAGAADAPISEFLFSLYCAGGYLSTWSGLPSEASRPYDLLRSGLVPSEGAATLVLEEARHAASRGANIYAEILGYENTSQTNHANGPDSYVSSLVHAISRALELSGLTVSDVDYVCAHGNSIPIEDRCEALAHKTVFGGYAYRIPISSIKSMIGQPFAASGVMQAATASLALQHNVVPPTINQEHSDPDCDLDYVPNKSRVVRIRQALLHSHSLGAHLPGSHSALVLGRFVDAQLSS